MVGRLVQQQQVGTGTEGPGERGASQLSAGEAGKGPGKFLFAEADSPQHGQHFVAPAVAAGQFELLLGRGVGAHRLVVMLAGRHGSFEAFQFPLGRDHVGAARVDVFLKGKPLVARWTLVVKCDPGALLKTEGSRVVFGFAGQNPQQGRLPGPVAARKRHAVTAHELEGDLGEERIAPEMDPD